MTADLGVENGFEIVGQIIAGKSAYDSRVILRRQEEGVITIQVIENFSSSSRIECRGVAWVLCAGFCG